MKVSINEQELPQLLADPEKRRDAFTKVMQCYQQKLYWHIRRMVQNHDDADDILQNTFIKAWTNIDKFRGDSSILTWLYRIATNETMDFFNSAHTRYNVDNENLESDTCQSLAADEYFDGDEVQKVIADAIASLPPKQRQVFCLRYYDEMPYNEMSKALDTSEGALKASYHHAAEKVEQYVKSHISSTEI